MITFTYFKIGYIFYVFFGSLNLDPDGGIRGFRSGLDLTFQKFGPGSNRIRIRNSDLMAPTHF